VREATARGNPRHSVAILCAFMAEFSTGRVTATLHHFITGSMTMKRQPSEQGGQCSGIEITRYGLGASARGQVRSSVALETFEW
jgi:hypothetical protein